MRLQRHPQGTAMTETIFDKTSAGRDEVRTRARGLPQRLRSVLILVDGARTEAALRQAVERTGAPVDTVETLLSMGLIQPVAVTAKVAQPAPAGELVEQAFAAATTADPERFRIAKKFMNETVVDALGLRSFMFTLKLEKCATLPDLAALAPEYTRLVQKAKGAEVSAALASRLRELLI